MKILDAVTEPARIEQHLAGKLIEDDKKPDAMDTVHGSAGVGVDTMPNSSLVGASATFGASRSCLARGPPPARRVADDDCHQLNLNLNLNLAPS